ncbi:MAG: MFS transporter [Bryobacteraceae bacterium]
MVGATPATSHIRSPSEQVALDAQSARTALSAFFLFGLLMSFPGAILPAWGYHLRDDFTEVGGYFLALAAGLLVSVRVGNFVLGRRTVRDAVVFGCALASVSFLGLALASPPAHFAWRVAGILLIGVSAGLINSGAFQALSGLYARDKAATVNMAGVLFGSGCLAMALIGSSTFYVYTVSSTLILVALIPAFAAGLYRRAAFAAGEAPAVVSWRDVWVEVRSPGAVLFTALLFFQFGNEWTAAAWIPIYLVQTIGTSPESSLAMLAGFWFCLFAGRVIAQVLLSRVGHGKILVGSAAAALFGCLVLWATNNRFGAWTGIAMMGLGFSPIYPLVVERIGHRFPEYHPGFFNGLLSLGTAGGLLAPWMLGLLADVWGIRTVVLFPFIGTILVFVLILLIWLEARLTGSQARR